jgi:hypothetical protein
MDCHVAMLFAMTGNSELFAIDTTVERSLLWLSGAFDPVETRNNKRMYRLYRQKTLIAG